MRKEAFEEMGKDDWKRIANCAKRVQLAMSFNNATVGEGTNGGASSYANVVASGKMLEGAAADLLEILRRASIIPK